MTNLSEFSVELADLVEATARSVVSVQAGRPVSGTIIGAGLILTAAHLLHEDEVYVGTPDGRTLSAGVVGRDPASDLGLLRVAGLEAPALSASAIPRVGELLLAVGRPRHGVQATLGLLERQPSEQGPGRGWMASGAAPFRGVSGGALVDARGGLVGLLNAGVSRGELLAVPAARALRVAELLGTGGRVPRGYLGLATQPVHFPDAGSSSDDQAPRGSRGRPGHQPAGWGPGGGRGGRWARRGGRVGLTAVQVEEGSPAAQAGLRVGDVLLALDGQTIRHPRELLDRVRDRPGEQLVLRVLRGGEEQDVTVTVGER